MLPVFIADSIRMEADDARLTADSLRIKAESVEDAILRTLSTQKKTELNQTQKYLLEFYQGLLTSATNNYNQSRLRVEQAQLLYSNEPDIIRNRRRQLDQNKLIKDRYEFKVDSLKQAMAQ